jgi:hypothetical protein
MPRPAHRPSSSQISPRPAHRLHTAPHRHLDGHTRPVAPFGCHDTSPVSAPSAPPTEERLAHTRDDGRAKENRSRFRRPPRTTPVSRVERHDGDVWMRGACDMGAA